MRILRAVDRHRRAAAAFFAGVSVIAVILVVSPPPPPATPVVTAARDLPPGRVLSPGDVELTSWSGVPPPSGALSQLSAATGRVLTGPMRAGEPLTDARLVGSALAGQLAPGLRAVPVPIADPGALRLVSAGDRVDVLAASLSSSGAVLPGGDDQSGLAGLPVAHVVATNALVLSVPEDAGTSPYDVGGLPLIVLAVDEHTTRELAAAAVASRLSLALRPVTSS